MNENSKMKKLGSLCAELINFIRYPLVTSTAPAKTHPPTEPISVGFFYIAYTINLWVRWGGQFHFPLSPLRIPHIPPWSPCFPVFPIGVVIWGSFWDHSLFWPFAAVPFASPSKRYWRCALLNYIFKNII